MTSQSVTLRANELNMNSLGHDQNELIPYEYTEHSIYDVNNEVDPDNNFLVARKNDCAYYSTDEFNCKFNLNGLFSLIHFNSRSLYAHFDEIKEHLTQLKQPFDIIAVTETWINEERETHFYIEGYEFLNLNRTNKGGGGVGVFIRNSLHYEINGRMTEVVDNLLECLTIEIHTDRKNTLISCVYRTPGSKIETFTKWMEETFSRVGEKHSFICGDFNIDLLNFEKHEATDEFINTMYSMSFYPRITRPTRVTAHSATLIDNIFSNDIQMDSSSGILVCDITDHLPVFTVNKALFEEEITQNSVQYSRVKSEEALLAFQNALRMQNWSNVYKATNVNDSYEEFIKLFLSLYDQNCPIKQYDPVRKSKYHPWITKGLARACKKKNKLYKEFVKYRTIEKEIEYKTYKNKLINIMRNTKRAYYQELLELKKTDTKGIWNILNKIINRNSRQNKNYPNYFLDKEQKLFNMDTVAHKFNEFFVSIGPELSKNIPANNDTENVISQFIETNPSTMFLRPVNENEIVSIVQKFKVKYSRDSDGVDMATVKKVIKEIAQPLVHICNLSFQTGTFPTKMKTAKVIPLYKTGNKHQLTNYRPISILPQFSKILEKLFNNRLESFSEQHNLLSDCQYGFRSERSTAHALIDSIEEITNSLDSKKYAIGIFLDLKKAFDTIDHKILLHKLNLQGIKGVALQWVESYLANRKQFVKLGDSCSSSLYIPCGVPQGSVLGPKFFTLYINDICNVSNILKLVLFADDTNIFLADISLEKLLDNVKNEMSKLQSWFISNKLSLNLSKTKYIIFGNKHVSMDIKFLLDGKTIERVKETKFLGVTIDEKINWKAHIKMVHSKVARSIGVISKVKHSLDTKSLQLLYYSLVTPYLNYCAVVWGNNYKTVLQPLEKLQKRIIRIIHKVGFRDHTKPLFYKSKLFKFTDTVEYLTLQLMYRARNRQLPHNIQKHFLIREGGYNLRGTHKFKHPRALTTRKSFCVSVCGVKIWNDLKDDLRNSPNIRKFKNECKDIILSRYLAEM